jgi:heat shock protein HslJ
VGDYDYTVTAAGAGGTAIQSDRVTVSAEAVLAAKAPAGPAILSFSVTPDTVALGGCVTVDWTVGGDVQNVRLLLDDQVLLDNAPLTASGPNCLTTPGAYTYVIEATSADGVAATAQAAVTVAEPTPAPPVGDASAAGTALLGQMLNLTSYFDGAGALLTPLEGTEITALFQADGTVAGTAGCNTYSGGFQAPGDGTITVGPLVTTQMFCAEPVGAMNQEAQYLSVLQTAARYEATATALTLYNGADQVVATFAVED